MLKIEASLPRTVLSLMELLRLRGIPVWLVGGCLRDLMRGEAPGDWDLAAGCTPEELWAAFPGAIPTGLRYGTLTLRHEGLSFELTCCRSEGDYRDGRHPAHVVYTRDIHKDLARRDFTAGAMAWNREEGLTDPYGGAEDIAARRLRAVGQASARLQEDALRILRALRFAATLGFSIEPSLSEALHREKEGLRRVSQERVFAELKKILRGIHAEPVLTRFADVLHCVLPGVRVRGLGGISGDAALRLAFLLCSLGPGEALPALDSLRPSSEERRRVRHMLVYHSLYTDPAAALRALGPGGAADVLALAGRDPAAAARLLDAGFVWHPGLLRVTGADAREAGFPPGPALGKALRRLAELCADGLLPNEPEPLRLELGRMAAGDK